MRDLPVRLSEGTHRLLRFDATWRVVEERELRIDREREADAARRARLPDHPGSWLALRGGDLDGWWVAESPAAFVAGPVAEARLDPTVSVVLRPDVELPAAAPDGEPVIDDGTRLPPDRRVTVDRVAVVDGRRLVRLAADPALAGNGRWLPADHLEADPTVGAPELRILARIVRPEPGELRLRSGDWILFRFDEAGRVAERRTVAAAELRSLATRETLEIGPGRFHLIDGGDHDGWAVRDDARVELRAPGDIQGDPA